MHSPLPVDRIYQILKTVDDPEIGINIVDLGFVYHVQSIPGRISIQLALTTDACPMRNTILEWIHAALAQETDQNVLLDTESAPAWTPTRIRAGVLDGLGE